MFADYVARMINPPFETPFGPEWFALIGVPFLLFQVRRNMHEKRSNMLSFIVFLLVIHFTS